MVPRVARMRPAKAVAHQLRQQAAVVDMGMGQQHGVDVGGAKRKGAVVQFLQGLLSLKQAAVDQEASGSGFEEIAGARHGAGRAAKSDRHAHRDVSGTVANAHLALQGVDEEIVERDGVGGMRHAVCRTDRANAGLRPCRGTSSSGNRACVTTASIVVAPAAVERLGAGDHGAAGGDDIVDDQGGATGNACRDPEIRSRRSGRRGGSFAQRCERVRAGRRDRSPRAANSASGPTTMVAGSTPVLRSVSAIAGMAERLSDSIPGNTAPMSGVRCRCASTVIDTIDASGDQRADRPSG